MKKQTYACKGKEGSRNMKDMMKAHREAKELARQAREKTFGAGLIGRGGTIASNAVNVELLDFVEPEGSLGGNEEECKRGIQVNLNDPVSMEERVHSAVEQQSDQNCVKERVGEETDEVLFVSNVGGTQDSDPFELGPIRPSPTEGSRGPEGRK
ncbi:hypothetical protein EV2_033008 [Malus domestica]